jgi:hypothetical protein
MPAQGASISVEIGCKSKQINYLKSLKTKLFCAAIVLSFDFRMRLLNSVANSWQNFPASPAKKFLLSKKNPAPY